MSAWSGQRAPAGSSMPSAGACASCRFFRSDPRLIEAAIPGLTTMSSGYAAVRADDGFCDRHDRYLRASSSCGAYEPLAQTLMQIEAF